MWKRTTRTTCGEIDKVYQDPHDSHPVYDQIIPGELNYNKNHMTVKYVIYNQNAEQLKGEERNKESWWEDYYDSYETDSLGLAFKECIRQLLSEKTDVKFFIQILDHNNNSIAETFMDIPSDIVSMSREKIKEGINKRIHSLEQTNNVLNEELTSYKTFIKYYNSEKLYQDWVRR